MHASDLTCKMDALLTSTDLKIDNLDRVSIPTKIVATFDVEHPILGTTYECTPCPDAIAVCLYLRNLHCFELVDSNLGRKHAEHCLVILPLFTDLGCSFVVPRIGCSTSKVATIFVGIETLSRLSIFRSMLTSRLTKISCPSLYGFCSITLWDYTYQS